MKKSLIIPAVLFLVVFLMFLMTLPDINTGIADSDELLTVAKIFGVAHPPSYPLYTVLSAVFGRLPVPFLTFAGKINLSNTIYHAFTVVFIYLSLKLMLESLIKKNWLRELLSVLGSLSLAFCISFWFYGIVAEVFSLNNLFASMLIYLGFLYAKTKKTGLLLVAAVVGGLGLSNQQAIVLLYPAFFLFMILQNWRVVLDWKLVSAVLALLAVSFILPYTYLPIAAQKGPVINWENAQDLAGIYRVITRRTYAETSPVKTAYLEPRFDINYFPKGFGHYSFYLYNEFGVVFILLSLIGMVYLLQQKKFILALFIFLGILGGGLFFSVYSPVTVQSDFVYFKPHMGIHQRFFLLSLLFYPFLTVAGAVLVISLLKKLKVNLIPLFLLLLSAVLVFNAGRTFWDIKKVDFSLADKFGRAVLESLEPNAILLCFTDHSCFTGLYLQEVEGVRKDVFIIHAGFELVSLSDVKKREPKLLKTTAERVTNNHSLILMKDLIRWNIDKRPIYVSGVNNDVIVLSSHGFYGDPYFLIPKGCVMKLSKTFTPLNPSKSCQELTKQVLKATPPDRLFISFEYPAYLTYQYYFNALQYADNNCPKLSKNDLQTAIDINPKFSLALISYEKFKNLKNSDRCDLPKKGPTVEELIKKVKEAEEKKDIPNKMYYLSQITSVDPNNLKARLELADSYHKLGGVENAKIEYQDILVLDPDNKEAKKGLLEVEKSRFFR